MKLWKLIIQWIAGVMLLCAACHAAEEVILLDKGGLQLVARLPDDFKAADPAIIVGIRNSRTDRLLITRGERSEGFQLSLYDRAGKRIPAEKEWKGRNDPRLNDAGLRAQDEIASGGRLDSPSFPLNKIFGERWREGKWLEVEWGTRVSHLKQPAGWWMVGSIDIQALAKDGSLKMVATPDRAWAEIEGAKPEEELVRLAMERAKEKGIQVPEGVKPLVHYRGYDDTYVSIRWEWKDGDVVRSFYVGIDRVTGKISDFVNAGPKK